MTNLYIKHKHFTQNGIDYIGHTEFVDEKNFSLIMKSLCEKQNVSIFWQLRRNGEFFMSVDYCPAKICSGSLID